MLMYLLSFFKADTLLNLLMQCKYTIAVEVIIKISENEKLSWIWRYINNNFKNQHTLHFVPFNLCT